MTLGVPDPIVRRVTGHRSRELERYQHLTPELRALTVNLIATELFRGKRARKERESGTPTGTARGRRVPSSGETADFRDADCRLQTSICNLKSTICNLSV